MPRAGISFSGHKEICCTVLNEPHREPMEQQISFQQGECNLVKTSSSRPTAHVFLNFFFFKNHVFKSHRNWDQDVKSLILLLFMGEDELLSNLNHFLSHKCLRISGLLITSYKKNVTHWSQ